MRFVGCVVVWAAAVNCGPLADDAAGVVWATATAVLADVFVLAAVVLAAVTVWSAALADVVLTSLACGAVTAYFAVEPGGGSAECGCVDVC